MTSAIPNPCTNALLRGDGVDEVVWTTVRKLLLNSDTLAKHLQDWLDRSTSDAKHNERLKLAENRLKELNRQRERLIDAYQTGALPLDDFQTRRILIEERILAVEQEQAELRSWQAKQELAARQAAVGADIPVEKTAYQINQLCGSGLRTVALGYQAIKLGDSGIVVAGGQESMSQAPHIAHLRNGAKMGDVTFVVLADVSKRHPGLVGGVSDLGVVA